MKKDVGRLAALSCLVLLAVSGANGFAEDWPMWRCDAARSAVTDQDLAFTLHLQWVREYPPLKTAWPDPIIEPHRMPFDRVYQPVVEGKTLYVGSSAADKVTALDTDTGAEKWVFHADGPVRFAPAAWKGKVYFTSDDGSLYCVKGSDGSLLWKFRGGPSDRKALGNGRLISTWPARGGPVVADGAVYFAAGIWPFMGIFVHAVDAETGKAIWTNDGSGQIYMLQPHNSPAFAGLAPQGALVVAGDRLLVPNGRAVPACLDRRTGKLLYYRLMDGKDKGGSHVSAGGDCFFNGTRQMETLTTLGAAWNGEWTVKTSVEKGKWTAAVRIPFATIGGAPGPDGVWHFNFCRSTFRQSPQFAVTDDVRDALKLTRVPGNVIDALASLKDKPFDDRAEFERAAKKALSAKDFDKYGLAVMAWSGPQRLSLWSPGRYPLDAQDCSPVAFGGCGKEWIVPPPVKKAPTLTGKLDDPAWGKGLRLRGFIAAGTTAGKTPYGTTVALLRDEQALYLGFECEQPSSPDVRIKAKKDDEDVTRDESIEIFLDRHDSGPVYYRFAFNAAGCRQDSLSAIKIASYRSKPQSFMYDLSSGDLLGPVGEDPAVADDAIYTMGNPVAAHTVKIAEGKATVEKLWECPVDGRYALIKAGERLYVGGKDSVSAIDIPKRGGSPKSSWSEKVEGTPWSLLAADDKLFAVTLDGRIYCFGAKKQKPKTYPMEVTKSPPADKWSALADQIIERTGARQGYCLVAGLDEGRLAEELARKTDLHVIAVDPDAKKAAAIRKRLDAAGLYGSRVAVHEGDPMRFPFPAYIAGLIVTERPEMDQVLADHLAGLLRPYGGVLCRPEDGTFKTVSHDGGLKGAADWTHQDCDIANSLCSKDDLVRAPLGLLWFGGPPPAGMISRHGHPPTELVVGGRIFVAGVDMVRAVDAYTGRVLWEAALPGVGHKYATDYHAAGVNRVGSVMAAASDALYAINGRECARLDPAAGKKAAAFKLPPQDGDETPTWGFVGVWEDLLLAGSTPTPDDAGSRRIVVMDRTKGEVQWTYDAAGAVVHNGIVAGGGRLYCLDKTSPTEMERLKRRGEKPSGEPKIICFDTRTGKPIWSKEGDIVFGGRLALSEEHGILLLSGRPGDGMRGETTDRLVAFNAADGAVRWDEKVKPYRSPPILHGDTIIAQPWAWDLLTGKPKMRKDPVTGEETPWTFSRNYGCNTVAGSRHLLTFRSAAAGYYDLAHDGGTGNFGGFKSGCSINLIAADGVLAAPDFTATCTCSYPNQTSLALAHMPENESWTIYYGGTSGGPIARVGVNLGAPGDRLADDGTLWLEYPTPQFKGHIISGGDSWPLAVEVDGDEYFCRHSSCIEGDGLAWVAASGCRGIRKLDVLLRPGVDLKPEKNVIAVQVHQGSAGSSDLCFDAELICTDAKGKEHILVPFESEWRYSDTGKDPGDGWQSINFDDSEWQSGRGKLGYGDGDERTKLSFGSDPKKKRATAFFRKTFDLNGAANPTKLKVRIRYDDGFAMVLNGKPLFADKVRHGAAFNTFAQGSHEGKDIETFEQAISGPGVYTVRLHFAEPDELKPGDRIFDVFVQDKPALTNFDIVKESGGPRRGIVKEIKGVRVERGLTVRFDPKEPSRHKPVLCGVEVALEK